MGKNNQQRRAAKRKARAAGSQRSTPTRPADSAATHHGHRADDADRLAAPRFAMGPVATPTPEEQARRLVQAAADAVGHPEALDDAVRDLVVFAGTAGRADPTLAARLATAQLLDQVMTSYENGWQPADVMHVVRARLGNRFVGPVAGLLVQDALQRRAPERAPQDWLDQLSPLTDLPLDGLTARSGWTIFDEWPRAGAWDGWHDVATLTRHLLDRYPMSRMSPPPSSWPNRRAAARPAPVGRSTSAAGHDPKKLATIRALLAKAEATQYVEEADAFTEKAQDLMTRYAIDEALVTESAGIEVRTRRVHIDNPYASAKAQLLATVARVNRVKAIWDDEHGIVTIVGLPVDLELVEMLFTSLLVQATRAMTEAGAVSTRGHRLDRSPSFRRGFLLSYADRIGERLTDAGAHAQQDETQRHGGELLPVLARRSAAVEQEVARLFPDATQSRVTRVDARGWHAGRAAADRAVLVKGQVGKRGA